MGCQENEVSWYNLLFIDFDNVPDLQILTSDPLDLLLEIALVLPVILNGIGGSAGAVLSAFDNDRFREKEE